MLYAAVARRGILRRTTIAGVALAFVLGGCSRDAGRNGGGEKQTDVAAATLRWLQGVPSPLARELSTAQRCNLLAAVLTYRASTVGDAAALRPAILEDEVAKAAAFHQDKPLAGAVVKGADGEQALFGPGESCGDRMVLLSLDIARSSDAPPRYVKVTFRQDDPDSSFDVQLTPLRSADTGVSRFVPILGKLANRNGEWLLLPINGPPARARRMIDAAPRVVTLSRSLPPGRAEASFQFDTGGDIMGASAKQAGLAVVVRYGKTEMRQTIASCDEPSSGSALGGGGDVLDVAACGAEYHLITEAGVVRVDRQNKGGSAETVARIVLPNRKMRADRPSD